jgi:flagellar assembly factor FliW
MIISTQKFGDLEIPEDKIIRMEKPILGFEHLKKYCLVERDDCEPFLWYQAVDDPNISFLVVNPLLFYPDFRIEVNPREIEELRVRDVATVETYAIVTVPKDPQKMSLNLQGPILINTETCLAKQLIMVNSQYLVKHYVLQDLEKQTEKSGEEEEETIKTAVPV